MPELTHVIPATNLWDIGKPSMTRFYAAECSVWSGFALFGCRMYFKKLNEIARYYPTALKFEVEFVLFIRVGNSLRQEWAI